MSDTKHNHPQVAAGPYRDRALTGYRTAAVLLLNTVLLFLLLETGVTGLMAIGVIPAANAGPGAEGAETLDPRARLSYYRRQEWSTTFWTEFSSVQPDKYRPWVIWSRPTYHGRTINIDGEGRRVTPGASCGDNSYVVFVFGGSTVWGTGSPDWGTIPAYLQAAIQADEERPVCVTNFGEAGFVSTQGVVELLVQLRNGNVPDLVIFYDGVNDVLGAYQSGHAGDHHNLPYVATLFEDRAEPGGNWPGVDHSLVAALTQSNTFALLTRLMRALRSSPQIGDDTDPSRTKRLESEDLADQVANVYLENYRLVGALAQVYGFTHYFFWQPVISIGDKPLVEEELGMRARMVPDHVKLYEAVYRRIELAAKERANLFYVAEVFDEQQGPIWIDPYHTVPEGNQLVAVRVLSSIRGAQR